MNIYAIDTEDDSKGNVLLVNIYDGRVHHTFTELEPARKYLAGLDGICWAVNLEYDLINVFWGMLSELRLSYGKARIIKAVYNKLTFYDTLNHWKMSVNNMGEYLRLPKLKFNPHSVKYCQRDTEIAYKFVALMSENYKRLGIEPRSTISLTSFNLWKSMSRFKLKKIPDTKLLKFKQAYYGGRVECFYIGKQHGNIKYVDINSMYPFVMLDDYPSPYKIIQRYDIESEGISHIRVRSRLKLPVLPYRRKDNKIIFPNGVFSGYWANNEIRFAVSKGVKIIKVYDKDCFIFPLICRPFNDYIKRLYAERLNVKDELMKYTYKIFMNSLYGKFAQGNERSIIESVERFKKRKEYGRFKIFENDKLVLHSVIDKYPVHTNFVFSLYTTAKARIILYELIDKIQKSKGTVLYCDTDSVIYKDGIDLEFDTKLGGVKLEGDFKDIEIKTCKFYKLDKSVKIKGIPKLYQEMFFDKEAVTYKKPLKLKEAIRRDLRPNIWIDFTKVKVFNYDKGVILKGGFVEPFILK